MVFLRCGTLWTHHQEMDGTLYKQGQWQWKHVTCIVSSRSTYFSFHNFFIIVVLPTSAQKVWNINFFFSVYSRLTINSKRRFYFRVFEVLVFRSWGIFFFLNLKNEFFDNSIDIRHSVCVRISWSSWGKAIFVIFLDTSHVLKIKLKKKK